MKVYLVNAGMCYYPDYDNTKFVTTDKERAEESKNRILRSGKYDWVYIVTKGVDK